MDASPPPTTPTTTLETLLLHLVRGAGLQGLTGIPPRRGEVVRPLLTTSRAEIEAYLKANGLAHVEDSTNTDEGYARNRIRRQVVPVLRQLNPRLTERAADDHARYLRTGQRLSERPGRQRPVRTPGGRRTTW